MRKQFIVLAMLAAANLACAGNNTLVPFVFFNYTADPGNVFLGAVLGPAIGTDGNSVNWSTDLSAIQEVGLQVSPTDLEICNMTNGVLTLDPSLYTGDTISIIFGQPAFPTGIECGCFGSACSLA
jgi:hypothetical protein